jgi:acetoin utilization protein AcuC
VSWTTSQTATGHNPADPVDQAIMATRKAVFPLHGLMP